MRRKAQNTYAQQYNVHSVRTVKWLILFQGYEQWTGNFQFQDPFQCISMPVFLLLVVLWLENIVVTREQDWHRYTT